MVLPEDGMDMRELSRLVLRASRVETAGTGQALLLFDRGRVWLGSLPRG